MSLDSILSIFSDEIEETECLFLHFFFHKVHDSARFKLIDNKIKTLKKCNSIRIRRKKALSVNDWDLIFFEM